MNYNQLEAYEEGLYAGPNVELPAMPMWARELECEYSSLWIIVPIKILVANCPHIHVKGDVELNAYCEVAKPDPDLMKYDSFTKNLEMNGLNLLAYSYGLAFECFGATLQMNRVGQYYLAGLFSIVNTLDKEGHTHTISVKTTFKFPKDLRSVDTASSSGVVGYFKTPCIATMNPYKIFNPLTETNVSSNPLFGFFESDEHTQPKAKSKGRVPTIDLSWLTKS